MPLPNECLSYQLEINILSESSTFLKNYEWDISSGDFTLDISQAYVGDSLCASGRAY